jgi:uncharacterized protein (TIGR03435 family)
MQRVDDRFGKYRKLFLSAAGFVAIALPIAFGLTNAASGLSRSQNQPPVQNPTPTALSYKFEVATIKPSRPGDKGGIGEFFGENTFRTNAWTLKAVVREAYGTPIGMNDLVSGGPDWIDSERYDILAKMDAVTADQLQKLRPDERTRIQNQMLQQLLADRFKLAIHREPRKLPVYFLTIAKNGSKLKEAKPGDKYEKAFPYADKFADAAKPGEIFLVSGTRPGHNTQTIYAFGVSMPTLARQLTFWSQRTVQDRTGLTGSYDVVLEFCKEQSSLNSSGSVSDGQDVPSAPDPCGVPPLLSAVQQQLGLKMEPGKGPVEIIVVDHAERPSGN